MKAKGMKGVSPFIASVLTILFSVMMLGIVLTVITPTFKRAQDSSVMTDAFQNLNLLNSAIKEVASEAQGSKRTVSISVSDGEYIINATTDLLIFTYEPSEDMRLTGTKGDIEIEHGSVFLDFFNWYVDGSKAEPVWKNTSGKWVISNYKYRGEGGIAYHNLSTIENYKFSGNIYNVSGATGGQIFVTPTNPERLVGFWPFENASGTRAYDYSGNLNNGTLTNMADPPTGNSGWNTTHCKYGNCLNFDSSNDHVLMVDSNSLDVGTNDFTLSAWIKTSYTTNYQYIISKGDVNPITGTSFYFLRVDTTTGYASAGLRDGSDFTAVSKAGNSNIADGGWHHILATFDRGSVVTIYVDGQNQGTEDISGESGTLGNSIDFTIGTRNNGGAYGLYFNGTIDEVKIWNISLSAEEVAAEYELSAKKLRESGSQSVSAKTPNAAIVLANPDGVTNFDDIKVSREQKEQKLVIPYSKIDLNGTLRIPKGEHQVLIKHMGTNTTLSKPIIEVTSS